MRSMKDSGIDWIGEIPESWRVQRGKNIMKKLERPTKDDDEIITCFRDGEVTLRSKRREDGFTISLQETGYQGIDIGDLVVHGMDGFAGSIGISDSRGKATPVLNVLDSDENKKYLMYYLRCAAFCGLFLSLSTGIRIRTCDTNWNKLKNVLYLLPSRDEQKKISDYLDCQCAIIDKIIDKTKESIEEYKKLKQTIITEAVIKGVRGERPMKESGLKNVGSIPIEYKCCKLKYVIDNISSGESVLIENTEKDELYPVYGGGNLIGYCDKYNVENQLLIGRVGARCGCVTRIVGKAWATDNALIVTSNYNNEWLYYALISLDLNSISTSSAQPLITSSKVSNEYIIVPPLDEMKSIVEYLNEKVCSVDTLIEMKTNIIFELEEYKKALIYGAVTGKREI